MRLTDRHPALEEFSPSYPQSAPRERHTVELREPVACYRLPEGALPYTRKLQEG